MSGRPSIRKRTAFDSRTPAFAGKGTLGPGETKAARPPTLLSPAYGPLAATLPFCDIRSDQGLASNASEQVSNTKELTCRDANADVGTETSTSM